MMSRSIFGAIGIALLGVLPVHSVNQTSPGSDPLSAAAKNRAVVNRYCVACHNEKLKTAGLILDQMELEHASRDAEIWEKVIRKLRAGQMPPAGVPRPDPSTLDALVNYLETEIDRAAAAAPNPGRPAVHRLNRSEYANAIRDLLAVDTRAIDIESLLPADDAGYGFDNIGDVLSVSPMLMEGYISASRKISRLAIGDSAMRPVFQTYDLPRHELQYERMSEELPFGSRGGIAVRHHFPVDAEYVIRIRLQRNADYSVLGLSKPRHLDVRLDGQKIQRYTIGGSDAAGDSEAAALNLVAAEVTQAADFELRVPVSAGFRSLAVTFQNVSSEPEGVYQPLVTDYSYALDYGNADTEPAISSVAIGGPFETRGLGETPSRNRIFVCEPSGGSDEEACAGKIISILTRRAFRRPVEPQDVENVMAIYRSARQQGTFDEGIQTALQRILVDPEFLFRIERDPPNLAPGAVYRISDLELASRLSFFLWSSIPDDELLELAEKGKLNEPAVLEQQVRRLLADSRSGALVDNFAGQWLYLRNVRAVWPNPDFFPDFAPDLREDFQQETELLVESMLREDRSVLDLLRADYTFLNERLAAHYGIPDVYGSHFRRVAVEDENRKGLLGQASILAVTSYATRTSPVLRGKWVLEQLMGTPPPPPPPDVPSLQENNGDGKPLSVRQLMEKHRVNPACASCHKVMDPLGFALENFDAVGRWRTMEANLPVDASGVLPDGTRFEGPAELRRILLSHPEQFVRTVTNKLLTYALGRGIEYYDAPAVRAIMKDAAQQEYRWSSLILGIAKSTPFQTRRSRQP